MLLWKHQLGHVTDGMTMHKRHQIKVPWSLEQGKFVVKTPILELVYENFSKSRNHIARFGV